VIDASEVRHDRWKDYFFLGGRIFLKIFSSRNTQIGKKHSDENLTAPKLPIFLRKSGAERQKCYNIDPVLRREHSLTPFNWRALSDHSPFGERSPNFAWHKRLRAFVSRKYLTDSTSLICVEKKRLKNL
jgi:hypothetical protein